MRRYPFLASVMSALLLIGCQSSSLQSPLESSTTSTVNALPELRTRYAKLHEQYAADCINGTPEHIQQNRELCELERKDMAPIGNALMEAEVKAAQQANKP